MDKLEVGELRAGRVLVDSGNGLHVLEVAGTPDGVAATLENQVVGSSLTVQSEGESVGVLARLAGTEWGVEFAFVGGRPQVTVVKNGKRLVVSAEILEELLKTGEVSPEGSQ